MEKKHAVCFQFSVCDAWRLFAFFCAKKIKRSDGRVVITNLSVNLILECRVKAFKQKKRTD